MNLYSTLKTKLGTYTGLQAHPLRKPDKAAIPCVIFRGSGTRNYLTQTGNTDFVKERVLITILANDFPTLRTKIASLESNLVGNDTDFVSAIPVNNTKIEDVDEDGINFYMREFFIVYLNS